MATNNYGKGELVERVVKLIEGLDQFAEDPRPIAALGDTYTRAQMREKLQAIVDLRQRVAQAKSALKQALAVEAAQMPDLLAHAGAFRSYVKLAYSTDPEALGAHGIVPKVREPPTAETTMAAVAKRAATRKARHTMGPRQKAKVKGDVVSVTVVPVRGDAPSATAPGGEVD
ncbi:MAG TPA: hypothetical protein VHV30_03605 [Polyangiaceae bacterium]|jgi:hypothetical protein|nr:hypothetical protein [Polyangiaceae bacterium]